MKSRKGEMYTDFTYSLTDVKSWIVQSVTH